MALRFDKYSRSVESAFKMTGAGPLDLRFVVKELKDLYGVDSSNDRTWHNDTGLLISYNGMLVSVEDLQEVYMCIDNKNPYDASSWKKIGSGGDIDLSEIHKRISDVSQLVIDVSIYAHSLGKAFIFKGPAKYNPNPYITPDDSTYILHVDDSEVDYRPGNVYQTIDDGKEWVFADVDWNGDGTADVSRWIELGSPYDIDPGMFGRAHIIKAVTNSSFVSVSTYTISDNDTSITTIYVDVSTSDLDTSAGYETTGFVTDNQLRTYMSWVVLDSDPESLTEP